MLSRVAQQIRDADSASNSANAANIPGVKSAGPKMLLRFTCDYEGCADKPTITRIISKASYEKGVVLVRCPCEKEKQHLIADHLGWLSEPGTTIETTMAERGQEVQRMLDEGEDILHVD